MKYRSAEKFLGKGRGGGRLDAREIPSSVDLCTDVLLIIQREADSRKRHIVGLEGRNAILPKRRRSAPADDKSFGMEIALANLSRRLSPSSRQIRTFQLVLRCAGFQQRQVTNDVLQTDFNGVDIYRALLPDEVPHL